MMTLLLSPVLPLLSRRNVVPCGDLKAVTPSTTIFCPVINEDFELPDD